jgi:hypothetical protein
LPNKLLNQLGEQASKEITMNKLFAQACWFVSIIVSFPSLAQEQTETAQQQDTEEISSPAQPVQEKMLREAQINLRTTVTGNQEQPRVMYILPWQSPTSPTLEMEMLSSEQDAVFGHVERDELQRSLEATGELDDPATE